MTPTEALALTRVASLPRCRLIDDPELSPCALHAGHSGGCDPHAGPVDWRAMAEVLAASVDGYHERVLADEEALDVLSAERDALRATLDATIADLDALKRNMRAARD